ncbi:hypothetical protein BIW11_02901, partial [Tropilaelaps mercedesae]
MITFQDTASPSVSSGETWDEPRSKQPRLDLTLILPSEIDLNVTGSHQRENLAAIADLGEQPSNMSVSAHKMQTVPVTEKKRAHQDSNKHKKPLLQQSTTVLTAGVFGHPPNGNHLPQTKLNNRPPSGSYEGVQDVGYSSESSTQLSAEDKGELLLRIYCEPRSGSADTTPESPEMPSRDSGLSGGGSPRKCYPLSAKCSPIDDIDHDDDQVLKDVLDADYVASPVMRLSGSAADFYMLTSCTVDSDAENAARHGESQGQQQQLLDKTLTPEKGAVVVDPPCLESLSHSLTIDNQVVRLRKPNLLPLLDSTNNKANRLENWRKRLQVRSTGIPKEAAADRTEQDSCDASGEFTSESSSSSSDAGDKSGDESDDWLKSTTTLNAGSMETVAAVAVATPTDSETPSKPVNLRSSGKKRRSRDRPWSVTDVPPQHHTATANAQLPAHMSRSFTLTSSTAPMGTSMSQSMSASMTSTMSGLNDSPAERRRHSRVSKTKTGSNPSSGSDSEVTGDGVGAGAKRNSSTSLLIDLCEPVKNKPTPARRRRLGSKAQSKSNLATALSGHSSANDNTKDPPSDRDKKSDADILVNEVMEAVVGDQGSVVCFDNMWDHYEEHYSEQSYSEQYYSEKEMEYDVVKRVLEFGDDYRSFIGSTSDTSSLSGLRSCGSGNKKGTANGRRHRAAARDSELDSEQEQLKQQQNNRVCNAS